MRWWTYLQTLPVRTHYSPGVFNEFPDYLSREDFAQQFRADVLQKAEEAFKTLHVRLDLFMAEQTLDWTTFALQESQERSQVPAGLHPEVLYGNKPGWSWPPSSVTNPEP